MSDRDAFTNDVLERLVKANQDYQREHGHYVVPLAERLVRSRRTIALAHQMAIAGVGPDTTPEQCLAAIASFLGKRGSGQWEPPTERDEPPEGYIIPEGDERCGFTMDACQCMKRKAHEGLHACSHGGWRDTDSQSESP